MGLAPDLLITTDGTDSVRSACLTGPGPPEKQLGSLIRDGYFVWQELQDAAAGYDEETINDLQTLDRQTVPVHDIGLYLRESILWAVKPEEETP